MKASQAKSRAGGRAPNQRRSARPVRWTKEEDALLGTLPDERLAKKLRRSLVAVRSRRHLKRISLRRSWRPAEDKLLGTQSDHQIARRLRRAASHVSARRRQLGIPSFDEQQQAAVAKKLAAMSEKTIARLLRRSHRLVRRPAKPGRTSSPPWAAREDELLGKWPDERLARFLGRTRKAVQGRRHKLRILYAPPGRRWTAEEERLLDPRAASGPSRKRTGELARQLDRSAVATRIHRRLKYGPVRPPGRRWTRRELRLLGTRPDLDVAALIGRTYLTVQTKRCGLGIDSYRARRKFRWTPAKDRWLGTLSDEALAKRFGTHRKEVEGRRHALGIAAGLYRPWTPEEERLVGTMRDEEVARRLGRTRKAVAHRLRALSRTQPKRQPRRAIIK